jgi:hypothetical protein
MSWGTGDSRHYTGPTAARDAQIMTITALATPPNGDVNGLPASVPRALSRHSGRRHRDVRSAWLPQHPHGGGCRQGGHVDWLAVHLRRVHGSALPPRLPLLPALTARQPGVAAAHAGAGSDRRAVRPRPWTELRCPACTLRWSATRPPASPGNCAGSSRRYTTRSSERGRCSRSSSTVRRKPELETVWFGEDRADIYADLAEYLRRRPTSGQLRPMPDTHMAAHLVG